MDLASLVSEVWSPFLLVAIAIGTVVGLVLSAIPGVAGVLAIVVLLPLTARMSIYEGLGMLLGAYKAIQFGGCLPAIAMNMPGTPESAAGVRDGYRMAQLGYPKKALRLALDGGTIGDLVATIFTAIALPLLAVVALAFGPRELFAVAVLALLVLPTAISGSPLKSWIALLAGLALSMVGPDPISGFPRMSYGSDVLRSGIDIVPLIVGVFSMSVVIAHVVDRAGASQCALPEPVARAADDRGSLRELMGAKREMSTATGLGIFLGILPGPGATMAAYSSYGMASRFRRNRGTFGTGNARGLITAETANNATVGPSLVPLLSFGIPGSAVAGIIAGAFLLQGFTPGPLLFREEPNLLYGFIALLFLASLINWPLGALLIEGYRFVPSLNPAALMPVIGVVLVVSTYAYQNNLQHVYLMLIFGVLGYLMTRHGYAVAPLVVAFLIGPIFETQLRRSLEIGNSWSYLFTSGPALGVYALTVFLVVSMLVLKRRAPSVEPE